MTDQQPTDDPYRGWTDRPAADPWVPAPAAPGVPPSYSMTQPLPVVLSDTLGRVPPARSGPRTGTLVAAALVAGLLAGAAGGAGAAWLLTRDDRAATDPGASLGAVPTGSLSRPPESVAGIAQQLLPTVVSIEVSASGGSGTGSGFVIRQDGYLLTNNHVVSDATTGGTITVRLADGSANDARIVGRSPTYDLAVLKIDRAGLPVAPLGDSDSVVVGDQVIAVGSPLGLAGTVTTGIISATERSVTTGRDDGSERSYLSALQTDAAINPGNSGGPLLDGQGRVIGVNSAIATLSSGISGSGGSIGLGFSIPINQARRVAEQLIRDGVATYPIIGASLDPAYDGEGSRIAEVTAGGPADRAGLRPGDVITAFDGTPVARPDDLIVRIRSRSPNDDVRLDYLRSGAKATAVIRLGSAEG